MKSTIYITALLLCACSGDPKATDSDQPEEVIDEITLPTEAEVEAIDAAEKAAYDGVTEENADTTLDELESRIGGEDE